MIGRKQRLVLVAQFLVRGATGRSVEWKGRSDDRSEESVRARTAGHAPSGSSALEPVDAGALEHAVRRGEGEVASGGSFSVNTGSFTGRMPRDK